MSRSETAESYAREAVDGFRGADAQFSPSGFAALALDRFDDVAAVLLASRVPGKVTVRAWFFAFERVGSRWSYVFDHNDEWLDTPFQRPSTGPPLYVSTSARGDATSSGERITSFAGMATAEAHEAILKTAAGSRPVEIDGATGAFIVVAPGGPLELALRDEEGEVIDRLAFTPPPPL